MKRKITFLLSFTALFSYAQNISFADPQFKSKLLQTAPGNISTSNIYAEDINGNSVAVDANGDGEIQISEAQNIKILKITSPSSVIQLNSVAELSHFSNLTKLDFGDNNLSEIDLSDLNSLEEILIDNNKITAIDVSHLTNLKKLVVQFNLITSLDVSNQTQLYTLFTDYNPLTEVNLTNTTALESFSCTATSLTTIDLSDSPVRMFNCTRNPLLESVNINNGAISSSNDIWYFSENPNIRKFCADAQEIPWLQSFLASEGYTGVDVSNCTTLNTVDLSSNEIKIFPNPVSNFIFISNTDSKINEVQIFDFSGKLIYNKTANAKDIKIDFKQFPAGVYMVQIYSDKGITSKKIIKK